MDNKDMQAFAGNYESGLTKREYFAGLAMQGMINDSYDQDFDLLASNAVEMSNALLKALESEV